MVVRPTMRAEGVRKMIAELKKISPELVVELRKELRSGLKPQAQAVAAAYPSKPPLSRMGRPGDLQWSAVRATVSITPGRSRRYRQTSNLVSIRAAGRPDAGVNMAELAGSRSKGYSKQGRIMIAVLNERFPMKGRGGRFAFNAFRQNRDEVVQIADGIIRRYAAMVSRRLK